MQARVHLEPESLSLRHNFLWTLLGNVVYAGCQGGMLVVLAKFGSAEMVGQFALGLAVTTPVMTFFNLALRAAQATDAKREYGFGDYLALRLLTTAVALLILMGIAFVGESHWETALVMLTVSLAKACEAVSDIFYGLLHHHERMDRIAQSMMLKGLLSLSAMGAGVYLTGEVFWGTLGLAFTWAFVLVSYDMRCRVWLVKAALRLSEGTALALEHTVALQPRWEIHTLSRLTWLALPLGFATMLISLNSSIPRYFIKWYMGEGELGIFAAMAYLMVGGGMVVNALGQSASPRLARYYAQHNRIACGTLLLKLIGIGMMLGSAGVVVAYWFGHDLLTLLYRPEYAQRAQELFWLTLVASVGYVASFLGYGMTAMRLFWVQPWLVAASSIVGAVCCYLLIPEYGLKGAVWAHGASLCIQFLGVLLCDVYALYLITE